MVYHPDNTGSRVKQLCHRFVIARDTHSGICLFVLIQSERAARKATILQMATMYTVLGGTLLNIGVTFSNQGSQLVANGSFIGAGMKAVVHTCI